MKHLASIALLVAFWLTGCNLSEAEQLEVSRKEVESIKPPAPTVTFQGGNTIPLSELLTANWMKEYASKFVVNDPAKGTENANWKWMIQALRDDIVLFSFRVNPSGSKVQLYQTTDGNEWAHELADIEWKLLRATNDGWDDGWEDTKSKSASLLKIVDDRIPMSLRFISDSNDVKTGDTIRIEMTNRSSKDSTLVASDYSGMRMVGDYDAKLGPGDSFTFQWLVLVAPGNSTWLEISWSNAGQSPRYTFQVNRP